MAHKGPHISISAAQVVNRILKINPDEFFSYPQAVQELAQKIAEELFLIAYNPFIDSDMVRKSVSERFARESAALAHHYVTSISEGITMFLSAYDAECSFREEIIARLSEIISKESIINRPAALVEASTDATDLRMELPILMVEPENDEAVAQVVKLANEMKFAIIPRGGASGMTGGSVPVRKRTVILSLTRLTAISQIDPKNLTMTLEAGVITQKAIDEADNLGLLFTVDPASKTASTIGGNISENSGGPYAFEYGTTLDNLLSWQMVTPTGEHIVIQRINHPRHKIMSDETAIFEVRDLSGGVRNIIKLKAENIRKAGLGKDVTDKVLGGLPGMQKEGVDGVITSATFTLHKKPSLSRFLVLEFFGSSMEAASVVIGKIVALRDQIRQEGDYVKLSALEEFNVKYVRAIEYQRKSTKHSGDPISVILLQADGDDATLLDSCVSQIVKLVADHEDVAVIVAKDDKEGALFWEDRHKLSAIAKRTSGYKINEDVVIPMQAMPKFALYLETLNLECAVLSYREALQEIGRLTGMPLEDKDFNKEFSYVSKIVSMDSSEHNINDDDLELRAIKFMASLAEKYPALAPKIAQIKDYMLASRVIIASHMHAGDGNCHVNIPVNSNDLHMLERAEQAATKVMHKAEEMGGVVSGEHGIGITKIAFFPKERMAELNAYKQGVDPRELLNPGKLTVAEMPFKPFTFSFNRLIEDIKESGLADKERLIYLLSTVQSCTRCGKCKQVCPMVYAEKSYHYHPRNKNMVLGAITEAIYYSQVVQGYPSKSLLVELRHMVEHCTGCGRCTSVCPVKIASADVALALRAFLEDEGAGGHPLKKMALNWIVKDTSTRSTQMAKLAGIAQIVQNQVVGLVPKVWRERFENPLFSGKGPETKIINLYNYLHLDKGAIFVPSSCTDLQNQEAVFYFAGCGAGLFDKEIALAAISLLLKANVAVVLTREHLCCGYPLLSSGADGNYHDNLEHNRNSIHKAILEATNLGLNVTTLITACGSCRESISQHKLLDAYAKDLVFMDIVQYVSDKLSPSDALQGRNYLYHASCHPEWSGIKAVKSGGKVARTLEKMTGADLSLNPGCCGESGMGAISSPAIYNALRERKKNSLYSELPSTHDVPIIVGCPSCKLGINRILLSLKNKTEVIHSSEWLADTLIGENWQKSLKEQSSKYGENGIRKINFD